MTIAPMQVSARLFISNAEDSCASISIPIPYEIRGLGVLVALQRLLTRAKHTRHE